MGLLAVVLEHVGCRLPEGHIRWNPREARRGDTQGVLPQERREVRSLLKLDVRFPSGQIEADCGLKQRTSGFRLRRLEKILMG